MSNVVVPIGPRHPLYLVGPLAAGLVALDVMKNGPVAHTTVGVAIDADRRLKDASILSVNRYGRAGFEPIAASLWVAATKPASIYIARLSPGIDDREPDGDDLNFLDRCSGWCSANGVELADVLLIGRRGLASLRQWEPESFA